MTADFFDPDSPPPAPKALAYPPAALAEAGQEPIEVTDKAFVTLFAPQGWTRGDGPHAGASSEPKRAAKVAKAAGGKRRTGPPPPTMVTREDTPEGAGALGQGGEDGTGDQAGDENTDEE